MIFVIFVIMMMMVTPLIIVLLPGVCIESSELVVLALVLLDALLIEVPVADEDLVLASLTKRAEGKLASLGDALG